MKSTIKNVVYIIGAPLCMWSALPCHATSQDTLSKEIERAAHMSAHGTTHEAITGADKASELTGMGNGFLQLGRYEEAEFYFLEAYLLNLKTFGLPHYRTINCVHSLSITFKLQGRINEADALKQLISDIHKEEYGRVRTKLDDIIDEYLYRVINGQRE